MSNDLWSCNVYVHMLPARFARLLATGIVLRCWLPVVELVFSVKCWLLLCCSVSLLSIYIYIYQRTSHAAKPVMLPLLLLCGDVDVASVDATPLVQCVLYIRTNTNFSFLRAVKHTFTPVCTFAGVHMCHDLWSCNVYVHMLPARLACLQGRTVSIGNKHTAFTPVCTFAGVQ